MRENKYQLLLIDGKNLLHRSFAVAPSNVVEINGQDYELGVAYRFLESLLNLYRYKAADSCRLVVCWDAPRDELVRRKMYPPYKANRPDSPANFTEAMDFVKVICTAFGIEQAWSPEQEADDVIATLAIKACGGRGANVGILSADRDLLQLVDEDLEVFDPTLKTMEFGPKVWTLDDVEDKYGFYPNSLPTFKALAGDKSDNVPGITGIGPKKATELVKEYHTAAMIIESARNDPDFVGSASTKTKLLDNEEDLYLFQELCTIDHDVEVEMLPRKPIGVDEAVSMAKAFKFTSLTSMAMSKTIEKLLSVV